MNVIAHDSANSILDLITFFWVGKKQFPEAHQLIHVSYFLPAEERCFRPFLTHNTIGFNPIRARVAIKTSHRWLLTHYYLINNN